MATISTITIGVTDYDLMDADARNQATGLKAAYNNDTGNLYSKELAWENGSINKDTGADVNQQNSVRSPYIPVTGSENLVCQVFNVDENIDYVYLYTYLSNNPNGYIERKSFGVTSLHLHDFGSLDSRTRYIRIVLYTSATEFSDKMKNKIILMDKSVYNERFVEKMALGNEFINNLPINALSPKRYNNKLTSSDLEVGAISNGTGELIDRSDRVRTKRFLYLKQGTNIGISASPRFNVWEYDPYTLECTENTDGWKTTYTVIHDSLVRIMWQTDDVTLPTPVIDNGFYIFNEDIIGLNYIGDVTYGVFNRLDRKIELSKKYDLRVPSYVKQISHRGLKGSGFAPESTEPAYILSYLYGYQAIEGDVRITSDGKYVIHHNAGMPSDSEILIADHTLDYLRTNANMGTYNGTECEILEFEDFINLARRFGMEAYVDLGKISTTQQIIEDLYAVVNKYGMNDRVTWLVWPTDITTVRTVNAESNIAIMVSDTTITETMLSAVTGNKFQTFVNPKFDIVTAQAVSAWRAAGFGVQCWIVDYGSNNLPTEEERKEAIESLIEMGIDGITLDLYQPNTDYVDNMFEKWGINQ